ncbi:hypothetical protein SKAU_G00262220 [Synaphobranchus kaupii]|uniref:Uncharacterized protein n=1 Tax=Synaphobranchus kaupii TaxID=118154 RepID=A0A9Q1EYN3_SYNKA|nr:hypothetical protein SKAU_G00262220 [Synaphobranchus kaupii]
MKRTEPMEKHSKPAEDLLRSGPMCSGICQQCSAPKWSSKAVCKEVSCQLPAVFCTRSVLEQDVLLLIVKYAISRAVAAPVPGDCH